LKSAITALANVWEVRRQPYFQSPKLALIISGKLDLGIHHPQA